MIVKLIELITGKDDLERVACREDLQLLNDYLKNRSIFVPKQPMRFLDADTCTQEEFLELIEDEAKDLGGSELQPWILEVDGKKHLPAFSGQKKMNVFSTKVSRDLNKVFALGSMEVFLPVVLDRLDIDFIDLNPFCSRSWEISVKGKQGLVGIVPQAQ